MNELEPNEFYDAWWFLYNHKLFQDEFNCSRFTECLDVQVEKVNPNTNEVDDDKSKNTKTEIWLEIGKYDKEIRWHDIELDCGGATYEEAIIKLSNLVKKKYIEV